MLPLIAVIGPVDPSLLTAWVQHYRQNEVERFLLAFHFPAHVPDSRRTRLLHACADLDIIPELISNGPWHEHTNGQLRDALRERSGDGWHMLADADEFHVFPGGLPAVLAEAEASGTGTAGGVMLDRIAADGRLASWDTSQPLDDAYPLGGFLTHEVVRGDCRKIVLAHSTVAVASGNHRAEGHRPTVRPPVAVHHFKWRDGVEADIRRRAQHSADGTWQDLSPARLLEAQRLFDHLEQHGGRIAIDSPQVPLRPVTLDYLPRWWAEEAGDLVDTWQPPHRRQGETSSSPSPTGGSNRA